MCILPAAHAGNLNRNDHALLRRQREVLTLYERFPLETTDPFRNGVVGILGCNQTLVGEHGMINLALAGT